MMRRIVHKSILIIFAAGLIIAAAGCRGAKGDVYVGYSWTSAPLYLYDENPSVPATVSNGAYYTTNEGDYYMEYTAWDSSSWWMVYSIIANEGEAFFKNGEPAYFEIALYSFGPSIYRWNDARGITSAEANPESGEPEPYAGRGDSGTETVVCGDYTMRMEYGRKNEKEME